MAKRTAQWKNKLYLQLLSKYLKPMGKSTLWTIVWTLLTVCFLTACSEDGELVMPVPKDLSEQYVRNCLNGKGWMHVSSHELKDNLQLDKDDYWQGHIAIGPQQYFFKGDSITTFVTSDGLGIKGYTTDTYQYQRKTHQLNGKDAEYFKLIDVNENELKMLKYQAFNGNGRKIYVYSIYRRMTDAELQSVRQEHPYNLRTYNADYPMLPEQAKITPADFQQHALNRLWTCSEVYLLENDSRYQATNLLATDSTLCMPDYQLSTDSLCMNYPTAMKHDIANSRMPYKYLANGYFLHTDNDADFHILTLTDSEMRVIRYIADPKTGKRTGYYCIYTVA